uniref:CARD domain-containing protein n=1 Tax=Plectus sambesii TaxID=2011161 RepID=A0A914WHD4_9BILA
MDELKQKAIKRHYANLVKCMNPLYVMDHLAHLLSLEDMELIRDSSSRPDKNRALLTMLFRQGEELKPFECFVEALKKTNQNHGNLAKDIIETYEHENGGVLADVPRTSLPAGEKTEHGLQM